MDTACCSVTDATFLYADDARDWVKIMTIYRTHMFLPLSMRAMVLKGLSLVFDPLFTYVVSVHLRVKMKVWNGEHAVFFFESVRGPWNHLHCYRNT